MTYRITHNGVTKTLPEWSISGVQLTLRGDAQPDVLSATLHVQSADIEPPFAYGETVTLIHPDDRILFVGTRQLSPVNIAPESESITITFHGPIDFLARNVYQQPSFFLTDNNGTQAFAPHPHVYLGISGSGALTCAQEITRILQSAIALGAPFQLGTIEGSVYPIPDEATNLTYEQALARMLSYLDNHVVWCDYATTPPTIHCRPDTALPTVNVKLASPDNQTDFRCQILNLVRRDETAVPAVKLIYEKTGDYNGQTFRKQEIDLYPLPTPNTPTAIRDFNVADMFVQVVPLEGGSTTTVEGKVESEAVQIDSIEYWKQLVPWLADPRIVNPTISDTARSSALPNRLLTGTPAEWMPIQHAKDTLSCKVKYSVRVNAETVSEVEEEILKFDCTVTDSKPGPQTYSQVSASTEADPTPVGLAQHLYELYSQPRWDVSVGIKEAELTLDCRPGLRVNLLGSRAEYATFAQRIVEATYQIDSASTSLTLGHRTLTPLSELVRRLLPIRGRRRWTRAASQDDGLASGAGATVIQTPKRAANDNTAGGPAHESVKVLNKPSDTSAATIRVDSPSQKVEITFGTKTIRISAADLSDNQTAQFRDTEICVNNVTQMVKVLRTASQSGN